MKKSKACGRLEGRKEERGFGLEANKKRPLAAVAVVLAVCAAALLLFGVLSACRSRSGPVVTCGEFQLSNTELGYYYWSEYFYFAGAYGEYLDGVVDLTQPLDQQAYSDSQTWQDLILEEALGVVRDTMSMVFRAQETGFTLPEDYAQTYEAVLDGFAEAAEAGGYDTVDAYLQASYGAEASLESFSEYLYNAHLAAAYSDALLASISPTEQETAAYFDLHAAEYQALYGVSREDGPIPAAVVLSFGSLEEAQAVYDEFLENGGTETALRNLGTLYCGGSGYLEAVTPDAADPAALAWLYDASRQAGDCAVVAETDGTASVVFYAAASGQYYWRAAAETDLVNETYQNEYLSILDSYTFLVNYDLIEITPPEGLYQA